MEQPLFVLVGLVLVSFCAGQDWTSPDFCHQKQCPQYKSGEGHQDFEERFYVATEWITTKVQSTADSDLMAANSRLKAYCNKHNDAGYNIPVDTWPVRITVTDDGLSLSWFVPPGTKMPENTDPSVTHESRPAATVYVLVFGDRPSIKSGQEHAESLREALDKAGKNFDHHSYDGVGYDSLLSLTHHSEIWIYAA